MNVRAVGAATAVAERHGLRVDGARVVAEGSNAMVHLRPHPVVARVATATGRLRPGGARSWLETELAVAGHATRLGAPVVAPSDLLPPGPYEEDGLVLSFWRHVAVLPAAPGGWVRAGATLRSLHEALASYAGPPLRPWGMFAEARGWGADPAVDAGTRALLAATGEVVAERLRALAPPLRPVHGDAHLANVLHTRSGPVWTDLEDAHAAPAEWDLACLLAGSAVAGVLEPRVRDAVRGYGLDPGAPHGSVLAACLLARGYVGAAWTSVRAATDRPRLAAASTRWLAWLRAACD